MNKRNYTSNHICYEITRRGAAKKKELKKAIERERGKDRSSSTYFPQIANNIIESLKLGKI